MGLHVFPILNPHSGSSQCTSPEHLVSCIKLGLAICFIYDNIHVSMLFSQIFPPSPSPTESKRLFYTSVSLLLSCIQGYRYHLFCRCMRQGAQDWCTGMTLRDGMGRQVGGGSGWGTHVNPLLIHINVWQKPLQYCKVISLQLK